ncbi:MAG: hypothetical protein AABZ13_10565, partial [Planctomycetota bacterium]
MRVKECPAKRWKNGCPNGLQDKMVAPAGRLINLKIFATTSRINFTWISHCPALSLVFRLIRAERFTGSINSKRPFRHHW